MLSSVAMRQARSTRNSLRRCSTRSAFERTIRRTARSKKGSVKDPPYSQAEQSLVKEWVLFACSTGEEPMCGGHGIHRLIGMATADLSAPERREQITSQAGNTPTDIENEVKLMYARGEIGTQSFRRLRAMAQARELKMRDIQLFQFQRIDEPG